MKYVYISSSPIYSFQLITWLDHHIRFIEMREWSILSSMFTEQLHNMAPIPIEVAHQRHKADENIHISHSYHISTCQFNGWNSSHSHSCHLSTGEESQRDPLNSFLPSLVQPVEQALPAPMEEAGVKEKIHKKTDFYFSGLTKYHLLDP